MMKLIMVTIKVTTMSGGQGQQLAKVYYEPVSLRNSNQNSNDNNNSGDNNENMSEVAVVRELWL